MVIKCVHDTGRLISGQLYYTYNFDNAHGNFWASGDVYLPDGETLMGRYKLKYFKTQDGREIPKILYNKDINVFNPIEDLKKGDVVKCKTNKKFKYLVKNGFYRVSDIRISKEIWNHNQQAHVKFEGYDREFIWNSSNFKRLNVREKRKLTLDSIFDQPENFSVEFKRKFELSRNGNVEMIESIAKSVLDSKRHSIGVLEWAIRKGSRELELTEEDFKELLKKPLSEIIEMYDNEAE